MAARICLVVILAFLCGVVCAWDWNDYTPLDEYVNRADPHFAYEELQFYDQPEYTVHVLNMTSQKWMDESFTQDPIWWHYLAIFIPKDHPQRITDAAFIHISGGNHNDSAPELSDSWMQRTAAFCVNTRAVAAYFRTVPYQPTRFPNETLGKVEDFIIGYTWKLYIEDPTTPDEAVVLFPMVKAAKHALDTMAAFTNAQDPAFQLNKFMPTGYSKRGWTTWLLGCVDQRIFAMAPTVFDLLNMQQNLEHHYRALGGWSWAFFPYWFEQVSGHLYHPRIHDLALLIDPLAYNERLTMPKLIISAAGDQFFPPDDANFFFANVTGPKFLQVWENDDHSLGDHLDQRDHNLQGFFLANYNNAPLPDVSWTFTNDVDGGTILMQATPIPQLVSAWWADTTNVTCEPLGDTTGTCRRDFRIRTALADSGIMWQPQSVLHLGNGIYRLFLNTPLFYGYRGFFMEMFYDYAGPTPYTMRFTTGVNIVPDNYPFPKCTSYDECKGPLK